MFRGCIAIQPGSCRPLSVFLRVQCLDSVGQLRVPMLLQVVHDTYVSNLIEIGVESLLEVPEVGRLEHSGKGCGFGSLGVQAKMLSVYWGAGRTSN